MELRTLTLGHPDARRLIEEVQQEYVRRYGGQDATPFADADFAPPKGTFVVGYLDGVAVASGGWRRQEPGPDFAVGDAELKRMYVVPAARRRGLARLVLTELERRATQAGVRRLVLETGLGQPEAIELYLSAGYAEIPRFGIHRCEPDSRCFGKALTARTPPAAVP